MLEQVKRFDFSCLEHHLVGKILIHNLFFLPSHPKLSHAFLLFDRSYEFMLVQTERFGSSCLEHHLVGKILTHNLFFLPSHRELSYVYLLFYTKSW